MNELRGDNPNEPLANNDLKAIYNRETIRWTSYVGGVNRDFFYPVLRVNSLLDSFDLIEGLSAEDQTRMEAEAKFIRAFCFWGAVKMFAQPYGYTEDNSHPGIPLPTYLRDAPFPRASVGEAYAQIEADLNDAIANLPDDNGVYATKDAAKALLAQVHFLKNDFEAAAPSPPRSLKATGIRWSSQTRTAPSCGCDCPLAPQALSPSSRSTAPWPPTTTAPTSSCSGGNPPPIRRSP